MGQRSQSEMKCIGERDKGVHLVSSLMDELAAQSSSSSDDSYR